MSPVGLPPSVSRNGKKKGKWFHCPAVKLVFAKELPTRLSTAVEKPK
jgi:hypothetical protein